MVGDYVGVFEFEVDILIEVVVVYVYGVVVFYEGDVNVV